LLDSGLVKVPAFAAPVGTATGAAPPATSVVAGAATSILLDATSGDDEPEASVVELAAAGSEEIVSVELPAGEPNVTEESPDVSGATVMEEFPDAAAGAARVAGSKALALAWLKRMRGNVSVRAITWARETYEVGFEGLLGSLVDAEDHTSLAMVLGVILKRNLKPFHYYRVQITNLGTVEPKRGVLE